MAADVPGPAGWRGTHEPDYYQRALSALQEIDRWAEAHGLLEPATRSVWTEIARADLEGRVLTKASLVDACGASRYLVSRVLTRAMSRGLLVQDRYAMNQKHTQVCLTEAGRHYLISSLDGFVGLKVIDLK